MQSTPEVVEGTWEEISRLAPKFNGHRLRVTILPDQIPEQESFAAQLISKRREDAAAYLRARLLNEATDDPDEIREAQLELDEMKRSMNEERIRSGAEPIF